MDQIAAARLLRESRFAAHAHVLAPLLRDSLALTSRLSSMDALALGDTRLGGDPDVPPGFEWPRFADRPQTFIAQLRLADVCAALPDSGLPATGFLYFFYDRGQAWGYDPAHRGAGVVLWADCAAGDLTRTSPPEEEDDEVEADDADSASFAPCQVTLTRRAELPDHYDRRFDGTGIRIDDVEESEAFHELIQALVGEPPSHHLLGYPQHIQGDMRLECQLVTNGVYVGDSSGYQSERGRALAPGAADWELLLQVDTDEDGPGWMWGDSGRIYFWIRTADLAARRFDRTWTVLQCY